MRHHVKHRLDDYCMELLDPESRQAFERHVESCSSCRLALREYQSAHSCLQWLVSADAPPEPGPEFYCRVQASIERRRFSGGWLDGLAATLQPRLAYPVALLGILLVAWILTFRLSDVEEGMIAMEFPETQFANMSFSNPDARAGQDQVMLSLVNGPEAEFVPLLLELDD
jgi:hypothetical protein